MEVRQWAGGQVVGGWQETGRQLAGGGWVLGRRTGSRRAGGWEAGKRRQAGCGQEHKWPKFDLWPKKCHDLYENLYPSYFKHVLTVC